MTTRNVDSADILILNAGSSSIRFSFYHPGAPLRRGLSGKLDRIGFPDTCLRLEESPGVREKVELIPLADARSASRFLISWLESRPEFASIGAVGHRLVHGMRHHAPEVVQWSLLDELRSLIPCDPEHLPAEIALLESFLCRHFRIPQVVCFDTDFHQSMPRVAQLLPIPRRFELQGLRRYGFHGLSCASLMEELHRLKDPAADSGRVILAHLGGGASMSAIKDGLSVDTSMGFTPAGGLMMGTRTGDLDPGILTYFLRTQNLAPNDLDHLVNHQSGLLGVSGLSADMRDLLAAEPTDERAREAIALFCHQARKWIGSLTAVLGGLDTLVFSGGVGEHCASIRSRICEGLGYLGVNLNPSRNATHSAVISSEAAPVRVRVIRSDEESIIAQAVLQLCGTRPAPVTNGCSVQPAEAYAPMLVSSASSS